MAWKYPNNEEHAYPPYTVEYDGYHRRFNDLTPSELVELGYYKIVYQYPNDPEIKVLTWEDQVDDETATIYRYPHMTELIGPDYSVEPLYLDLSEINLGQAERLYEASAAGEVTATILLEVMDV